MTNYKNQHFIPRFYIKNFSNDGTIGIYNLKTKSSYRCSYRSICAKKYFYSKDTRLEQFFSILEGMNSKAVAELIKLQDLNRLLPENRSVNLLSFITFQRSRANREKINSKRFVDYSTYILKYMLDLESKHGKSRISKEKIQDIKISWDYHRFKMGYEICLGPLLISDLNQCLFLNRTGHDFLFSDEPVVSYNACFNNIGYGTTGLQSPGLQIFCPLNKELLLFLYDSRYYNLAGRDKIEIFNEEDIDSINKLQFFNAHESLFFLADKEIDIIQELHSKIEFLLEDGGNKMEMMSSDNEKEVSRLYGFSTPSINYDLKLSFINIISPRTTLVPRARSEEIIQLSDILWDEIKPQWAK